MKDLLEISCGLDVHKEKIVACILSGPIGKPTTSEIREFTTLISDMVALRDWIVSKNCHHVAMESTGIYWIPVYEILEEAFSGDITLLVVNARHMKNVPGKKTDMRDSEWISTLLRAGLLNGSFIPEKSIREFRHLNRYRKSIIRDITSQKNRIEKFLQSSGFRLSSFVSDIFGASGRNIIHYLIEHGQIDKTALDTCLKTKTRNRIDEILMSVNGTLSEHQRAFLEILMNHYCSWADLCPGNHESAGKRKSTSITKGNPYIKSMLCEIAWVIAGKRNTYLSAWYWRIKQKKGAKKAIVALARKLLVIIYTMLKQGTMFDETFFEIRRKNCESKKLSRYIRELERHGYHIETSN